jgi:hypothetical protein
VTAPRSRHATNTAPAVSSGVPAELRAAAAILRALAGKATPGPGRAHDTWLDRGGFTASVLSGEGNATELRAWLPTFSAEPGLMARNAWNNAQWMAAMSPVVAEPLAGLLTEAANDIEDNGAHPFKYGHAIAFARAVLGGQS